VALKEFASTTIIRPNLTFGDDSYLVHYLSQCVLAGSIPYSLAKSSYIYNPVHTNDIADAVDHAFSNTDKVKGHIFTLNGSEEFSIPQIVEVLR